MSLLRFICNFNDSMWAMLTRSYDFYWSSEFLIAKSNRYYHHHFFATNIISPINLAKIPKPAKLWAGTGAKCDVLLNYIHPTLKVKEEYPNPLDGQRLQKCLLLHQAEKLVNWKAQQCYVFCHNNFLDQELHCVACWCKVVKEGPEDNFFAVPE